MRRTPIALSALAAAAAALALSGGEADGPRTPPGLPGLPEPLFGVALLGGGGTTAAVDAYGNVVDLRPGPASRARLAVDPRRQAAGSAEASEALPARVDLGRGARPLWQADAVRQRYLPGTNVLLTEARAGGRVAVLAQAARGGLRRCVVVAVAGRDGGVGDRLRRRCLRGPIADAARADRRRLARSRRPGAGAPAWARRLHERSLLVLRALTDRRTGAVAAGAREGWAYVWPRDAGAVALALAAAGHGAEARRVARFLRRLDLGAAARFRGDGSPVPGRAAQGDAVGWAAVAARAAGLGAGAPSASRPASFRPAPARAPAWRGRADYWEGEPGDYLGNALAAGTLGGGASAGAFLAPGRGLVRRAGDPGSGLDTAAAWAVRPFRDPRLLPAARAGLVRLADRAGRFGLLPGERWHGGRDPWTAPTAWSAWALAALSREARAAASRAAGPSRRALLARAVADRRRALRLLAALRRAATPLGMLPERVDREDGAARSTTPLGWSHAFAILALHELWPHP